MRTFEFNPEKCQANLVKHGIDFAQAQQLWDDPGQIAARLGVTRQSVIKVWLAERLESTSRGR